MWVSPTTVMPTSTPNTRVLSGRELADALSAHGLRAEVQGRPKHLYSIWKKMRGKGLDFARVFDIRAMRVIVADVPACYAVLARVHERYVPVPGEFDDYIARPKPNGYQSLHTVVLDAEQRPVEQRQGRNRHQYITQISGSADCGRLRLRLDRSWNFCGSLNSHEFFLELEINEAR